MSRKQEAMICSLIYLIGTVVILVVWGVTVPYVVMSLTTLAASGVWGRLAWHLHQGEKLDRQLEALRRG